MVTTCVRDCPVNCGTHGAASRAAAKSATWSRIRAMLDAPGPGKRVLTVENIGWNGGDAESPGMSLRRNHPVLTSRKTARPGLRARRGRLHAEPDQFIQFPDIGAFFKKSLHDTVFDPGLQPIPHCVSDQQMRAPAVRHAFDEVEAKPDSDGLPLLRQSLFDGRDRCGAPTLAVKYARAPPPPTACRDSIRTAASHTRFKIRRCASASSKRLLRENTKGTPCLNRCRFASAGS